MNGVYREREFTGVGRESGQERKDGQETSFQDSRQAFRTNLIVPYIRNTRCLTHRAIEAAGKPNATDYLRPLQLNAEAQINAVVEQNGGLNMIR